MATIPLVGRYELANRRKAKIGSIIWIILFLLLILLPWLTFPDPPPGQEGILVNLGIPDVGQGEENAPPTESEEVAEIEESEPEEELPVEEEEVVEPPTPAKPEPKAEKEVVKTEDPDAIALRKKKEKERQEEIERQKEREREKQKQEERERQKRLEEQRQKEKEAARRAKQKEADKLKNELGDIFGSGSGKGKTDKPGNQGSENGSSSDILEGISTGKGRVGGGLGSRGVRNSPTVTDNSQKTGIVVISVCVDGSGTVIGTPKFTQRGSTTADSRLINLAIKNAKRWKFDKASIDKQCGTIKYDFKVK